MALARRRSSTAERSAHLPRTSRQKRYVPPVPSPPLRVVLQTGASAGIARLFAVVFTFGSLFGSGLSLLLVAAGDLPLPHRIALPFVPFGFVVATIAFHVWVWRSRATDVFVDEAGVRVSGGRANGWSSTWKALNPGQIRVETNPNMRVTINGQTTIEQRLVVGDVVLGASTDPDEQVSFEALRQLLRDGARREPADPVTERTLVLHCPACGAPVAPLDAETTPCWRCDARVIMPDTLRDRVRTGAVLDTTRSQLLRDLDRVLNQPSALVANRWLAASLFAPYLSPLFLCGASQFWVTWIALATAVVQVSNLQVARRRAFARLAVVFSARPSTHPGAPLHCRTCDGPLPDAVEPLVRCPWCEADNLRVMPLARATSLRAAADDLATFLAEQRRAVRDPAGWLAICAVVAVGGVVYGLATP